MRLWDGDKVLIDICLFSGIPINLYAVPKIMYGPCWAGRTQTKKRLEVILQWTIAAISVLARTVSFL